MWVWPSRGHKGVWIISRRVLAAQFDYQVTDTKAETKRTRVATNVDGIVNHVANRVITSHQQIERRDFNKKTVHGGH
ncbi:unnamed protein product, partial [Mesorhabditis belari]|uniref:Uncharacterized protein n=1 Tax=Mesorhabditis belari TaxID=2138241 RepID=A0AAF3EMR7_9BILA